MAIWDFRPKGDLWTGVAVGAGTARCARGYTIGMVRYQAGVEGYSKGRIHALRNGPADF